MSRKFCFKFDIGVYFVGVVALSLSSVTFDVRPSGMASFGGFDLFWLFTIVIHLVFFLVNYVVYCSQKMQCCPWMMDDQKGLACISRTLKRRLQF